VMTRFLLVVLLAGLAFELPAVEEQPTALLQLRVKPGETCRYLWSLDSASNSAGLEKDKPLKLHVDKSIRVNVVLTGEEPPKGEDVLSTLLRFENLGLQENRRIGDASSSTLQIDRQNIVYNENNRVLVDSRNDIGMEKITAHQKALRFLEKNVARIIFDNASKQTRVEGDRLMLDTAHGGNSRGLFPQVSGRQTKVGESWSGSFEIPALAEVELDRPITVRTKATFAKWHALEGRQLAMIDVLSSWDSRDLQGKDTEGLSVTLTNVEGNGAGVYLLDPETGHFVTGNMTFQLRYRLEGEREGEKTTLDVNGQSRFNFKLLSAGREAPEKK
jgi:hypothetical protein